jgi:hypothetical protein
MQPRASGLWNHSEFLKLWAAQSISFVGSQFTLLALPLTAVLSLQASTTQMSILRTIDLAPALLIGFFVGALIDRLRRRPLLIVADIGRALLLGSIPVASYFGVLSMSHLYLVAFLGGILTMFFDVAHMSLLPALIPRERLVEGNSKLEVSRSIAMIVGPGIAGVLFNRSYHRCFFVSRFCGAFTAAPNTRAPSCTSRYAANVLGRCRRRFPHSVASTCIANDGSITVRLQLLLSCPWDSICALYHPRIEHCASYTRPHLHHWQHRVSDRCGTRRTCSVSLWSRPDDCLGSWD